MHSMFPRCYATFVFYSQIKGRLIPGLVHQYGQYAVNENCFSYFLSCSRHFVSFVKSKCKIFLNFNRSNSQSNGKKPKVKYMRINVNMTSPFWWHFRGIYRQRPKWKKRKLFSTELQMQCFTWCFLFEKAEVWSVFKSFFKWITYGCRRTD